MDDFFQRVYFGEALNQCEYAMNAVIILNKHLSNECYLENKEVFRNIHSLLTHASNISKIFWPNPQNEKPEKRASDLRESLGLPQNGHALKSRKLRDHLEHFDERMDNWIANSSRHNFIQGSIGHRDILKGVDDYDIMLFFDPLKKQVFFHGEVFDIQLIIDGVVDIKTKIEVYKKNLTSEWR